MTEISAPDLEELKEYIKEKKTAKEKSILWSFGEDFSDITRFAGCGNMKHMVCLIDMYERAAKG